MTSYIAIDWGSTNLRAWHYQQGVCVDERRSPAGITRLGDQTPAQVFASVTAGWPVDEVPVIMAGMVGSNAGWLSVPYLPCPASLNALHDHLTCVEQKAWIVPGLSVERDDNYNVMRGEETQLLGALTLQRVPLCVMPGTHAKWVQLEQDRVLDFRTVMTGELHHLLLQQSLIGAGLPGQETCQAAFMQGVERGCQDASVIARLFEVRAAHVLGGRDRRHVSEFLSGLLIGHEVALMTQQMASSPQPIAIIGGHALAQRYQQALTFINRDSVTLEGDVAFQHGMRSIANVLAH